MRSREALTATARLLVDNLHRCASFGGQADRAERPSDNPALIKRARRPGGSEDR
jgi:hypothetical protein